MKTGTIKFYNSAKGFGFIVPSEGGKDVFFHSSGILYDDPREDDQVEFDLEDGKKGPVAVKVDMTGE